MKVLRLIKDLILMKNIKILVKNINYIEASTNLIKIVFTILYIIEVFYLSAKIVNLIKIIYQLDNLNIKLL